MTDTEITYRLALPKRWRWAEEEREAKQLVQRRVRELFAVQKKIHAAFSEAKARG